MCATNSGATSWSLDSQGQLWRQKSRAVSKMLTILFIPSNGDRKLRDWHIRLNLHQSTYYLIQQMIIEIETRVINTRAL